MKLKKVCACMLCAALVATSLCACGDGVTKDLELGAAKENVSDEEMLTGVVSKLVNSGSSKATKEETVYVKTKSDGRVDSVIVSNWLKNEKETEELTDETELKDIVNVKGKETYKKDGNSIIWEANGSDIYYQGTSEKELPIEVKVSYELDGKSIAVNELNGKSGHVAITIDYKNNSSKTVKIGDKDTVVYTPFVAVSGMALSDKYSNVKVEGGTAVSDGKRQVVVGMAFPGLVDSLNGGHIEDGELLDRIEKKVDIPSKIVIEADVNDFEESMILTMVSADVSKALGLEDVDFSEDSSFADVKDSLDEFSSAGNELMDGTGKLKDGAQKLSDGTKDLVSGTDKLHDGIVKYTDGVSKVSEGASKLDNGASELKNGIDKFGEGVGTLTDGIGQVDDGARKLSDGAGDLKDGTKALADGAKTLDDGVGTLISKMGDIASGVGNAAGASKQISDGVDRLVAATSVETKPEDIDVSQIEVKGSFSKEAASAAMLQYITPELLAAYGITDQNEVQAILEVVSNVSGNVIPQIADGVATETAKQATAQAAAQGANEAKKQINAAITTAGESGVSLQGGAKTLYESLTASYAQLTSDDAKKQLSDLKKGADDLSTGASKLDGGAKDLKKGAAKLYEGTQKLRSGANELNGGVSQLSSGASSLKDGTSQLTNGMSQLTANSDELVNGSKTLADGSVTLVNGINDLLDGTIKLNDGMIKFNDEGISKLTDVFDTDLSCMSDRIKAIVDAGKEYKSFAGAKEGEECSVKFIIETQGM